jgi:hypothetical protein
MGGEGFDSSRDAYASPAITPNHNVGAPLLWSNVSARAPAVELDPPSQVGTTAEVRQGGEVIRSAVTALSNKRA